MILTEAQLETIRTHPQNTNLSLVIYRPQVVLHAVIDDEDIAKNSRLIRISGITPTGTPITVLEDTTLWVGTNYGGDDLGHARIRSTAFTGVSGTITVAENSHINWQDGQYLTAYKYWEVNPVYPRIIKNPNNPTSVIFYKDYDILYTNQNSKLGAFIQMGSHRVGLLDNGSTQLYWSASGTQNVMDLAIDTFAWEFEGGSPASGSSAIPGMVTYTTPGDYVTRLIVTSATGTISDTSYRYVSIRDKIGYGGNTPVVRWEMDNLTGSRAEGGYSADFTVYDNFDIHGNDIIMLHSDDWYGSTNVSLGGNGKGQPNMFFVGHIEKDSIKFDYKNSKVEFSVTSITGIMKETVGFSVSVESKVTPSTWYELLKMNCRRALYHYLRWHSTTMKVADVEFIGEDYNIQFFDADRTSTFDATDELMRGALIGNVCADRQGKIYMEVEPMAYPDPVGSFLPVMDISRRDWMEEPDIDEVQSNTASYLEYGGIYYRGPNANTFVPLISAAPGITPAYRGSVENLQGLALGSQSQLNTLTGNVFANKNAKYPTVSMELTGNYRNLDIAPYEAVGLYVAPSDTVRGTEISGSYIPDTINWAYDSKTQLLLASIDMKALVNGFPGDTVEFTLPTNDTGSPNFNSSFGFTPIALPPMITGTVFEVPDPEIVVMISTYGVLYTTNFDEVAPVWQQMNTGLTSGTYLEIGKIVVCPDESLYIMADYATGGSDGTGYESVYYCPAVGGTWTKISAYIPGEGRFNDIDSNKLDDDTPQIATTSTWTHPTTTDEYIFIHFGTPSGIGSYVHRTAPTGKPDTPGHSTMNGIAWANGSWYITIQYKNGVVTGALSDPRYKILTSTGVNTSGGGYHIRASNIFLSFPGSLFVVGSKSASKAITWGTGAVVLLDSGTPSSGDRVDPGTEVNSFQSISLSPSGNKMMGCLKPGLVFVPYRSSDGGVTWENLALVFPSVADCWDNCGDELRWVFAGGTSVKYTRDFGNSVNLNKEGNLSPDFVFIDISGIRRVR